MPDNQRRSTIVYSCYGYATGTELLAFNGELHDPATGCYLLGNGYRAYSPSLMRFLSPDDLSPFDRVEIHPYRYCKNDPVNHVDPSGHAGAFDPGMTHAWSKVLAPQPRKPPKTLAQLMEKRQKWLGKIKLAKQGTSNSPEFHYQKKLKQVEKQILTHQEPQPSAVAKLTVSEKPKPVHAVTPPSSTLFSAPQINTQQRPSTQTGTPETAQGLSAELLGIRREEWVKFDT